MNNLYIIQECILLLIYITSFIYFSIQVKRNLFKKDINKGIKKIFLIGLLISIFNCVRCVDMDGVLGIYSIRGIYILMMINIYLWISFIIIEMIEISNTTHILENIQDKHNTPSNVFFIFLNISILIQIFVASVISSSVYIFSYFIVIHLFFVLIFITFIFRGFYKFLYEFIEKNTKVMEKNDLLHKSLRLSIIYYVLFSSYIIYTIVIISYCLGNNEMNICSILNQKYFDDNNYPLPPRNIQDILVFPVLIFISLIKQPEPPPPMKDSNSKKNSVTPKENTNDMKGRISDIINSPIESI